MSPDRACEVRAVNDSYAGGALAKMRNANTNACRREYLGYGSLDSDVSRGSNAPQVINTNRKTRPYVTHCAESSTRAPEGFMNRVATSDAK